MSNLEMIPSFGALAAIPVVILLFARQKSIRLDREGVDVAARVRKVAALGSVVSGFGVSGSFTFEGRAYPFRARFSRAAIAKIQGGRPLIARINPKHPQEYRVRLGQPESGAMVEFWVDGQGKVADVRVVGPGNSASVGEAIVQLKEKTFEPQFRNRKVSARLGMTA